MKKMTIIAVLGISLMTAVRTSYAQSFAVAPNVIIQQDKIIVNYEVDSQFFDWYEAKRIIRFWRISDEGFQAEYDLGQYFPGRNLYLDSTVGMITNNQILPVSDTIFFGSDLNPDTQYRLSLGITGFEVGGNVFFWYEDTIATMPLNDINESAESVDIKVFPNPATDMITIQGLEQGMSLSIIDFLGKVVVSELCQVDKRVLDVSEFVPGIYIVNIDIGKARISKKIIVQ